MIRARPIKITDDCIIYNDMDYGWVAGKGQPKWHRSLYDRWILMWRRCRNPKNKDYENYKDCEIDERYRFLSNYINDVRSLPNFDNLCENLTEWHIDKDRVDPNNRHYTYEHLTISTVKDNLSERLNRRGIGNLHSKEARVKASKKTKKPVIGISIIDGSFIILQDYADMKQHHFNPGYIRECLNGKRDSYNDYRWFYLIRK